eukprot:g23959.t1
MSHCNPFGVPNRLYVNITLNILEDGLRPKFETPRICLSILYQPSSRLVHELKYHRLLCPAKWNPTIQARAGHWWQPNLAFSNRAFCLNTRSWVKVA